MTVGQLAELLAHHPPTAELYAYEGPVPGLVIADPDGTKLDFIFLPQQGSLAA